MLHFIYSILDQWKRSPLDQRNLNFCSNPKCPYLGSWIFPTLKNNIVSNFVLLGKRVNRKKKKKGQMKAKQSHSINNYLFEWPTPLGVGCQKWKQCHKQGSNKARMFDCQPSFNGEKFCSSSSWPRKKRHRYLEAPSYCFVIPKGVWKLSFKGPVEINTLKVLDWSSYDQTISL